MTVVTPLGSEFLVNTFVASTQEQPSLASLAGGGFVATWMDASGTLGDASSFSIKGQVYGANGSRIGTEFLVNTQTLLFQSAPTVTGLADGGFVVAWEDPLGELNNGASVAIKGQIYNPDGSRLGGEFVVNSQIAGNQIFPVIAGLTDGGFVISWEDFSGTLGDSSGASIKAQLYSAGGTSIGTEFLVNTQTANAQQRPAVAQLADGGFIICWTDFSGIGDPDVGIKAQRFNASGARIGGEFVVNLETFLGQQVASVTGLVNGGFVVSWQDNSGILGDTSSNSIQAQVFDAAGNRAGDQFLVNSQTFGGQSNPSIGGLANGGFVISWQDLSGTPGDTSNEGIRAQVYDPDGTRVGGEFLVNTETTGPQQNPTVAALANGNFVIAWQGRGLLFGDPNSLSIEAQLYSVNSAPVDLFLTNQSVDENAPAGTVVGVVTGDDPGDTLSFTLLESADGRFAIDASSGVLTVAPGAALDFETGEFQNVLVRATDSAGQSFDELFTIQIRDVLEPTVTAVGDIFVVNTQTAAGQTEPAAAGLGGGGFVIGWTDTSGTLGDASGRSVAARRFDANGNPAGVDFLVNTTTVGEQFAPTITGLTNGSFVVSWEENRFSGSAVTNFVNAQLYDADGNPVGGEFLIGPQTPAGQSNPSIAALANGAFVVSWEGRPTPGDTDGTSIQAQLYDSAGFRQGSEFLINSETAGLQLAPTITGLAGGGFVASWEDRSGTLGDPSGISVKAQVYDADGGRIGGEFLVNSRTDGDQSQPAIASLAFGGFVVTWTDATTAADADIKAQLYDDSGVPVGAEFVVDSQSGFFNRQSTPAAVGLAGGGFVIAYEGGSSDAQISFQAFDRLGNRIGGEQIVFAGLNLSGDSPTLAALADGGFVIGWSNRDDILAQRFAVTSAPTGLSLSNDSVAENAPGGTVVGTLVGIDPGDTLTYELFDSSGSFVLDPETGVLTVADGALLDFETTPAIQILARVSDQQGQSFDSGFQIRLIDLPESGAPTDLVLSNDTIAENSGSGTVVGIVTGIDPGDTLIYTLIDTASGRFQIDAATGAISVAVGADLDFETTPTLDIIVRATDQGGLFRDESFTIQLLDVPDTNNPPVDLTLSANVVTDDAPGGTLIGTLQGVDPDPGDTLTYALLDDAGGSFAVDAASGQLTVAAGAMLDALATPTLDIVVRVTDSAAQFYDETFSIVLTDAGQTVPEVAVLSITTVNERTAPESPGGFVIVLERTGNLSGFTSVSYTLAGSGSTPATDDDLVGGFAGGTFEFGPSDIFASITLLTTPDALVEPDEDLVLTLTGVTGGTLVGEPFVILTIPNDDFGPPNPPPVDLLLAGGSVAENAPGGTIVGTVTGVDPGDTLAYALIDDAGGRFVVDADTGVVRVAAGAVLDFETTPTLGIVVRVTDSAAQSYEEAFTLGLLDAAETMVFSGSNQADSFFGGAGIAWTIDGRGGPDTLAGAELDDIITGGKGPDTLIGESGNDLFRVGVGEGFDSFVGGAGFDTIVATAPGVTIGIASISSIERIEGIDATIIGTAGDDMLDLSGIVLAGIVEIRGANGADTITGSAINDSILGGAGNDIIDGGAGDDLLAGGTGLDILTGGAGADIFRGLAYQLRGDTITDYEVGDAIAITNYADPAAVTLAYDGSRLSIDSDGPGGVAAIAIVIGTGYEGAVFSAASDGLGGTLVTFEIA